MPSDLNQTVDLSTYIDSVQYDIIRDSVLLYNQTKTSLSYIEYISQMIRSQLNVFLHTGWCYALHTQFWLNIDSNKIKIVWEITKPTEIKKIHYEYQYVLNGGVLEK